VHDDTRYCVRQSLTYTKSIDRLCRWTASLAASLDASFQPRPRRLARRERKAHQPAECESGKTVKLSLPSRKRAVALTVIGPVNWEARFSPGGLGGLPTKELNQEHDEVGGQAPEPPRISNGIPIKSTARKVTGGDQVLVTFS
jgi:hypothetical protein